MSNTKKPHKFAPLIHQWADGEVIQCRRDQSEDWWDCPYPTWDEDYAFRIKPERKFPESSFSENDLMRILNVNRGLCDSVVMAKIIADAAVKQYILDMEAQNG